MICEPGNLLDMREGFRVKPNTPNRPAAGSLYRVNQTRKRMECCLKAMEIYTIPPCALAGVRSPQKQTVRAAYR